MHGAHHGANQPFDMTAEVWLPRGAVIEPNAILLAPPHQRLGVKLSGIVDMENLR
jgi:hypothetical protein